MLLKMDGFAKELRIRVKKRVASDVMALVSPLQNIAVIQIDE